VISNNPIGNISLRNENGKEVEPMEKEISRRNFLKKSLIIATTSGLLLCGGTTVIATYKPDVDKPKRNFGDGKMQSKTLIAYASKAGSTIEIATHLAEMLSSKGIQVDLIPVEKVTDLSVYQSVILGSAIRVGRILPEAMKFVENYQIELQSKTFGIFIVCMTLNQDTEENRKIVSDYLIPVRALVKPASEGMFAGVMDLKKLNLLEKLMIKAMKAPLGDFRDWEKIETWGGLVSLN
jgi:menaquinone-dependent protoporphyrinogen oxidase